jgi:hypothetical protein
MSFLSGESKVVCYEAILEYLNLGGPSSVQKNCGRAKTVDQTKNLENLMKDVCFGKGFDPATSEYSARPQFYPCHISLNHVFLPSDNFSL